MSKKNKITIDQAEYDELLACEVLLQKVLSDHDMLDDYAECYPELVKAAGFEDEDDEDKHE